jgi:hypothetical protein
VNRQAVLEFLVHGVRYVFPAVLGPEAQGVPTAAAAPALAERLPARTWKTLPCRTTPAGEDVGGRFAFVRVVATHPVRNDHQPPREEWLIIEWPAEADTPCDYWLSNLPADTPRERLARLARLRWTIELDYRQLKGELGLDHYEGRRYAGFHHHTALVTCARTRASRSRNHERQERNRAEQRQEGGDGQDRPIHENSSRIRLCASAPRT